MIATLTRPVKDRPKTALLLAACALAWLLGPSALLRGGERLLESSIALALRLLDGEDVLLGIG